MGRDDDGFDVDEFMDAEAREFTAVAAVLDAAKRQHRVGFDGGVDEDEPGFDRVGCERTVPDIARRVSGYTEDEVSRTLPADFAEHS